MSDIDYLTKLIQAFCSERDWDQYHNPKDLAIGLSTEANELLDIFRFKSQEDMTEMMNDPEKREAISEELADVFLFLLRFAQTNHFDLKKALESKLVLNDKKYPVDKVKGKNLKYNEY